MITLLVAAVCLLVLGLLFGRRFGVLVLSLAGGLIVSQQMATTVTAVAAPYAHQYISYIPAAIVVLPSVVLLVFAKGRHRKLIPRVVNAAIYAAAGLVFIIAAPGTPSSLSGSFSVVLTNLNYIVTGLVALAVLEVAFGKPSKKKLEEPKK